MDIAKKKKEEKEIIKPKSKSKIIIMRIIIIILDSKEKLNINANTLVRFPFNYPSLKIVLDFNAKFKLTRWVMVKKVKNKK